jgi:hypothetical protein
MIIIVGTTVPSYRLALERKRKLWKIFGQELDKAKQRFLKK